MPFSWTSGNDLDLDFTDVLPLRRTDGTIPQYVATGRVLKDGEGKTDETTNQYIDHGPDWQQRSLSQNINSHSRA